MVTVTGALLGPKMSACQSAPRRLRVLPRTALSSRAPFQHTPCAPLWSSPSWRRCRRPTRCVRGAGTVMGPPRWGHNASQHALTHPAAAVGCTSGSPAAEREPVYLHRGPRCVMPAGACSTPPLRLVPRALSHTPPPVCLFSQPLLRRISWCVSSPLRGRPTRRWDGPVGVPVLASLLASSPWPRPRPRVSATTRARATA